MLTLILKNPGWAVAVLLLIALGLSSGYIYMLRADVATAKADLATANGKISLQNGYVTAWQLAADTQQANADKAEQRARELVKKSQARVKVIMSQPVPDTCVEQIDYLRTQAIRMRDE